VPVPQRQDQPSHRHHGHHAPGGIPAPRPAPPSTPSPQPTPSCASHQLLLVDPSITSLASLSTKLVHFGRRILMRSWSSKRWSASTLPSLGSTRTQPRTRSGRSPTSTARLHGFHVVHMPPMVGRCCTRSQVRPSSAGHDQCLAWPSPLPRCLVGVGPGTHAPRLDLLQLAQGAVLDGHGMGQPGHARSSPSTWQDPPHGHRPR